MTARRWRLGELFVLRHAGFPFDWLEQLGLSDAALTSAGEVLEAEQALLETVEAGPAREKVWQAVRAGKAPAPPKGQPAFTAAVAHWQTLRSRLEGQYRAERSRLRDQLRERAGEPAVREAIFLSSPATYDNVWKRYADAPAVPDNADGRRDDRLAYTYLQRLCAKNETTSFFGPMGYGEIDGEGSDVEVRAVGPIRRRTLLSFWAVSELAKAIQRDPGLRSHIPIRFNPLFELTTSEARCPPLGLSAPLSPLAAKVLDLLGTGQARLASLAEQVGAPVSEVESAVVPLLKVACLVRGLLFETHCFETLQGLKDALATLPPTPAGETWRERLVGMGDLLKTFEQAGLAERPGLLQALESRFTALTGVAARRGEGQVYADRLVIYEEASSPFALRFGRAFADSLAAALSEALELSAAFGETVQQGYRQQMGAMLEQTGPLDFLSYAVKARPADVAGSRFAPVPSLFVAGAHDREARVPWTLAGTSSAGGRYALPDVCLAGPPPQPGTPARFKVVLGRVHHHLLLYSWLSAFHPEPARYREVAKRWLGQEPTAQSLVALAVRRRNKGFYQFPGRRVAHSIAEALELSEGDINPRKATVRLGADGPVLEGPQGPLKLYMTLDDFSTYPPFAALGHPLVLHAPLVCEGTHRPRMSVGEAVYQRERWQLPAEQFQGLSGVDLFLAVERARRSLRWPRFVFGRLLGERKPYLLDTRSPFAHDLLKHLAREAAGFTFEEMLPAPEDLWLRDERGRYTCELRMQAERWSEDDAAA